MSAQFLSSNKATLIRKVRSTPVDVAWLSFGYMLLLLIFATGEIFQLPLIIELGLQITQLLLAGGLILFSPGWLFLRLLRFTPQNKTDACLLAGATSVALWAIAVFIMNFTLFALGVRRPLTDSNLLLLLGILISFLSLLVASYGKTLKPKPWVFSAPPRGLLLSAVALPSAMIGAQMTTVGHPLANEVLLATLILISMIPIALGFDETTDNIRALVIYVTSLALIYHMAFISDFVWGWDVNQTFYLITHLVDTGYWNPKFLHRRTPLISIIFPVLSTVEISGVGLNWGMKIFIPIIYALLPVGVYSLAKEYLPSKLSIYPAFVVMFYQRFFNTIQGKQHFGALFLIALFLVLLKYDEHKGRVPILLALGFGLITSHYVSAFLFLGSLFLYSSASWILKYVRVSPVNRHFSKTHYIFMILMSLVFITWYIYTADQYIFEQLILIPHGVIVELLSNSSAPAQKRTGTSLLKQTLQMGTLRWLYFSVYASLLGLLGLGVLRTTKDYFDASTDDCQKLHLLLATPVFALFVFSIRFYGHFGIDRAIDLILVVAAPFIVVGLLWVTQHLPSQVQMDPSVGLSVLLAMFLLLNSGAVHFALDLEQEPRPVPQSFALEPEKNWAVFNSQEISSAQWYVGHSNPDKLTTAGNFGYIALQRNQNRYTHWTSKYYDRYGSVGEADLYIRNHNSPICRDMDLPSYCLQTSSTGAHIYSNGRSDVYTKLIYMT